MVLFYSAAEEAIQIRGLFKLSEDTYVGNIFLWNDNKIYNVASATWASSAAYECDMWVTILCMHIPSHVHFMTTYTGICLLGYIISLHACDYFDIIGQGKLIP